ncbi:MAG TPA: hypothetical protein VK550_24085 [Polyangiaceae bacterium]|nr:hypothetical protein [Polyangiaceae bacterium]
MHFNKYKAMDLIMSEACALSSNAKLVAVHLINRSRPDPKRPGWNMAWPAAVTMAKALSLSPRSVEQAIADLRRLGSGLPLAVEVERRYRPGPGGQDSNKYRFSMPAIAAVMPGDHDRNGRGLGVVSMTAEKAGHDRRNGGGMTAPVAEESSKESSKEPSKRESARARAALPPGSDVHPEMTRMPDDFVAGPEVRAIAERKGLDLAFEIEKFVAHAQGEGVVAADWQAKGKLWMLRAREPESANEKQENRRAARKTSPISAAERETKRIQLGILAEQTRNSALSAEPPATEEERRAAQARLHALSHGLLKPVVNPRLPREPLDLESQVAAAHRRQS